MFDTHAHVNFKSFKDDCDEVMKRARDKDLVVINVGSQISTSRRAVDLADKYAKTFAVVGLHPIQLQDMEVEEEGVVFTARKEEFNYEAYRELGMLDKVVAIGETGLDYHHVYNEDKRNEIIEKQKQVFHKHIDLANELNLPLVIHCRGTKKDMNVAYKDILSELKKNMPKQRGVMHCYGGSTELLKDFVELGFYVSFNGIITFDKTGLIEQNLLATPEDRILTETDCPYLAPEPYRGKRNEPAYVEFVIEKIADIKGWTKEKTEEVTDTNAKRLFNIVV